MWFGTLASRRNGSAAAAQPFYRMNLDRRSGVERRNMKKGASAWHLMFGRRQQVRRRIDRDRILYFDRYSKTSFRLIVLILVFSVLDAFLTLLLVDHGATELNPLMAFYLNIGPAPFVAVKYALTSLSIFVLLVYSNKSIQSLRIPARSMFSIISLTFAGVIAWQLFLVYRIVF
jgi:hypothetical protein